MRHVSVAEALANLFSIAAETSTYHMAALQRAFARFWHCSCSMRRLALANGGKPHPRGELRRGNSIKRFLDGDAFLLPPCEFAMVRLDLGNGRFRAE